MNAEKQDAWDEEFRRAIDDILSSLPQTGGFRTMVVLRDESVAWIHQCSLSVGWWSSSARQDYIDKFHTEPPLWSGLLHPVHLARLCDLSVERHMTLPCAVPFDISNYFVKAGAVIAKQFDCGDGHSEPDGYSSIFIWEAVT